MQLSPISKMKTVGTVERRLLSREKFYNLLVQADVKFDRSFEYYTIDQLYIAGLQSGLHNDLVSKLLDKSAKQMFKDNFLWRLLKKHFEVDLAIPFITGYYTTKAIKKNLITTRGKQVIAERIGGTGSQGAIVGIAIGVGAVAAAAGDTALGSESTTNGGGRGAATVTNVTVTTTNDAEQFVKTFTFTGSLAITEEGLFDSNTASSGVMLARQVFSVANVVNGDTLQITHKVQAT